MNRILFMHFPKYRHLQDISIALDTVHIYSYHPKNKTLSIDFNSAGVIPELMNYQFGIVALVGKNGAGKTTTMEVLMRYIGDGNSDFLSGSVILIDEGDEVVCYSDSRILVDKKTLTFNNVHKTVRYEPAADPGNWRRPVVYLSNHLDITKLNIYDPLFDPLGTSLILTPLRELLEASARIELAINDAEHRDTSIINALWNYQRVEFNRMIEWIGNRELTEKLTGIGFKVPNRLSFRNNYDFTIESNLKRIKDLTALTSLPQMASSHKPIAEAIRRIMFSLLLYLDDQRKIILNLKIQYQREFDLYRTSLISLIENNGMGEIGYDALKNILTELLGKSKLPIIRKNIHALQEFILIMESLEKESEIFSTPDSQSIHVSITSEKGQSTALKLRDILARIFPHAEVVTAKFIHSGELDHQLSSGEMSLLALIGKIREALVKLKGDVVFLLDEFELTFHPRWQQMIIDVITSVFAWDPLKKKRSAQIVLATHSPLILSDFPGESVYRITETGLEQQIGTRTFAMPLYDLFHDEFYLDESYIGAIARKELNALVELLDNNFAKQAVGRLNTDGIDSVTNYLDPIIKRIERIGDDFVRKSLMDRFYSKLPAQVRTALEIGKLRERIQRLEKGEGQ